MLWNTIGAPALVFRYRALVVAKSVGRGAMMSQEPSELLFQALWLLLLAMPVATATWTVTHEEIFREAREYCVQRSRSAPGLLKRKFFYVFTCEYCLSHYVSAAFVVLTGFQLLLHDWRGSVLAFLATVGVANVYMSQFGRLRIGIRAERLEVAAKEQEVAAETRGEGPVGSISRSTQSPLHDTGMRPADQSVRRSR